MILDIEKIKEITTGAARIEEYEGGVRFLRFNKAEEELYKKLKNQQLWFRSLCSAGINLSFETDSKSLFLKIKVNHIIKANKVVTRSFFSLDVLKNGEPIGYIDNIGDIDASEPLALRLPEGKFAREFQLGDGVKRITVKLPWTVMTTIEEIRVDDGSFVTGVKSGKTLLAYGDSITQGFDALRPSDRHIARLADTLGADEYCKAIGGDIFYPDLVPLGDTPTPNIITVAYGTNDWNTLKEAEFKNNCRAFYERLSIRYPEAKIFAITPIWRADYEEVRELGEFECVSEYIKEATCDLENVTLIDGFDLVDHDTNLFSDKYLHPNSKGFDRYFNNLYAKIKEYV